MPSPIYFNFFVLPSHCGQAQMKGFGDAWTDTLCDWSRHSHTTIWWKKTNLHVLGVYLLASTTWHYFNMDNKLQALLTLFSLLAAVLQLNSVFDHVAAAYMCRRRDVIWRTTSVHVFSSAISPTNWNNCMNGVVVPEEWRGNFCTLVQICWVRLHVKGTATTWALVDVFTTLTCTLYQRYQSNEGRLWKNTNVFGLS